MTNKTNKSNSPLSDLRTKYSEIRLAIKAHQEKNTNAHKALKKQIAQLLTTMSSSRKRGSIQIDSRSGRE